MKPAVRVHKAIGLSAQTRASGKVQDMEGMCLSGHHPRHQGATPCPEMALSLPSQSALCSYAEAKWGFILGWGETFPPPILMVLVTSESFHGDKTRNPGGLGEIGQITALRVLSYTLGLGRTLIMEPEGKG